MFIKGKSRTSGLSMPELMVAMTILFVVSTFVMSMFVTGARQTGQATQNQDLESLVRLKVSELREANFSTLANIGPTAFPPPNDRFQFQVELLTMPGEATTDARIVQVTVTHPEFGSRTGRTVRSNVVVDPGAVAWEKFGCGACHSLPAGGYPDDSVLLPLGPIPTTPGFDGPRPIPPGPGGLEAYIRDSIDNTLGYRAYDPLTEGAMSTFDVQGSDPAYTPGAAGSMSTQEIADLATWIRKLQ